MKRKIVAAAAALLCLTLFNACSDQKASELTPYAEPTAAVEIQTEPIADIPGETESDVTEYGILSAYDTSNRLLSYMPVEIVSQDDAPQLQEFDASDMEATLADGRYVYRTSEMLFTFPLAKDAEIFMLSSEAVLQPGDIAAITSKLSEHPPLFLCKLSIHDGEIILIEEYESLYN